MDNNTIIRNFAEARLVEAAYLAQRDEDTSTLLHDAPTTELEHIQLIQEIIDAMMHKEVAVDAFKRSKVGNNAGAYQRTAAFEFLLSLSSLEKQIVAWKLLSTILNSQAGQYSMPSWGKTKFKPAKYASFRERFDSILKALRQCKALTKNLFDSEPSWIKRVVVNPANEQERKTQNTKTNERRNKQVKFATKHMADEKVLQDELAQGDTSRKRLATESSSLPMRPAKRSSTKGHGIPTPASSTGDMWAFHEPGSALTSRSSVQTEPNEGHISNIATSRAPSLCPERLPPPTFFPARSETIPPSDVSLSIL